MSCGLHLICLSCGAPTGSRHAADCPWLKKRGRTVEPVADMSVPIALCSCNSIIVCQLHAVDIGQRQLGTKPPPAIGWVCGKCGRSYAPFVRECDACKPQQLGGHTRACGTDYRGCAPDCTFDKQEAQP